MKKKTYRNGNKTIARSFKRNIEQYVPRFNTRIDFQTPENRLCRNLALAGYAHDYISFKTGLSVSQVVLRLRYLGISIKQYRHALNSFGQLMSNALEMQASKQLIGKIDQLIVVDQKLRKFKNGKH